MLCGVQTMNNKVKAVAQYFVVGLVIGCVVSLVAVLLMGCRECGNCFCSCGACAKGGYKVKYTDFWTWDSYFNMSSILLILCGIIGMIYAMCLKNPPDIKKKIEYAGPVGAGIVFVVFMLVMWARHSALDLNGCLL